MASVRYLWAAGFSEGSFPPWPCPECERGHLRLIDGSYRKMEPSYSARNHGNEERTPLDDIYRFDCLLQCNVRTCGEIVVVHGDVELQPDHESEESGLYRFVVFPRSMHPAPPLATIPKSTPLEVSRELKMAYQLFWVDTGSCANRVRISVEKILDHFDVPKGKLYDRIEVFKKKDSEHAETFDALRYVGNVGSHEGEVKRDTLLDAFEVYQDALAQLFGKHRARIAALRKKIIDTKGK
jgi:Domain of unknown function (DUF4145)